MGLSLVAELQQAGSPAIAAGLIETASVSVMLLVPEGVLSDTREFLAKDTYAGETEGRRVKKPHQHPTV